MSWASGTLLMRLAVICLVFFPLTVFGVLSTGVGPKSTGETEVKDACKNGKIEAQKGGETTGGGAEYDNYIWIAKGKVYIECRKAPEGEAGGVNYCSLRGDCRFYSKNSQEAQNLYELYNAAQAVAIVRNGAREADARDVLQQMLSDSQMRQIDSMIGRSALQKYGGIVDYGTIVALSAGLSAPENFLYEPKRSYGDALEQAIQDIAQPVIAPAKTYYDLPINIDPSIIRDWSKPNIVDFLPRGENASIMNELLERSKASGEARVQNTFVPQITPIIPAPVTSNSTFSSDSTPNSSGWFTSTYKAFIKFLFGK